MSVVLFHRELGGAGRPPLILLHGFLGSSRNWQVAGAGLADRFQVFALDLRNHGRSPPAEEMSYPAMMQDLVAWLDARNLARAHVLGHSMGGKVAMALACRHPERVARLTVVDIAPKEYPELAHRSEIAAMQELRLGDLRSRAEAELRLEARVADPAMRKFLASNLDRDDRGQWRWIVNLPVLARTLPDLVRSPLASGDRFTGPARFILGGKSRFVAPEDHALIRHHFPGAEIRVLETSGHNPHIEAREAFLRLVGTEA